jgi:hypothetical protein
MSNSPSSTPSLTEFWEDFTQPSLPFTQIKSLLKQETGKNFKYVEDDRREDQKKIKKLEEKIVRLKRKIAFLNGRFVTQRNSIVSELEHTYHAKLTEKNNDVHSMYIREMEYLRNEGLKGIQN